MTLKLGLWSLYIHYHNASSSLFAKYERQRQGELTYDPHKDLFYRGMTLLNNRSKSLHDFHLKVIFGRRIPQIGPRGEKICSEQVMSKRGTVYSAYIVKSIIVAS